MLYYRRNAQVRDQNLYSLISNSYWIWQSFWGYRCLSGIVISLWRVKWKYVCSLLSTSCLLIFATWPIQIPQLSDFLFFIGFDEKFKCLCFVLTWYTLFECCIVQIMCFRCIWLLNLVVIFSCYIWLLYLVVIFGCYIWL